MSTKLKPLADRIVVKPIAPSEVSAGGILLPFNDQDEDAPRRGIVAFVGPGRKDDPMILKEGDLIIYNAHAGMPLFIDGVDYLVMRQTEALVSIEAA